MLESLVEVIDVPPLPISMVVLGAGVCGLLPLAMDNGTVYYQVPAHAINALAIPFPATKLSGSLPAGDVVNSRPPAEPPPYWCQCHIEYSVPVPKISYLYCKYLLSHSSPPGYCCQQQSLCYMAGKWAQGWVSWQIMIPQ
jgi:hypothetical protein